ncbi:hypothetical protein F3Y22_tig00111741pilonHSYRG00251 [Hibiscus syriacus]|uniref:OB domain-containing protein n=1 Tax=Hibiscus syriacus TaxID=106335 RepID=A0A6A2YAQ9_HIBSY|nr:hypothetical protein F3Y22_tig00111741pilonHSYRG00251 [Hibiscus syriacus]
MYIVECIDEYGSSGNGEHIEDVAVSLAGRIMSKRASNSKLFFYDLHGSGAKVQVMADASVVMKQSGEDFGMSGSTIR